MTQKIETEQPPLVTKRAPRQVAPVPVLAQPSEPRHRVKLIVQNGLVVGLIVAMFLTGTWIANPDVIGSIGNVIGQSWTNLLQQLFGGNVGSGLADKSPWIVARVGGILAYLLLFTSVALGLSNRLKLLDRFLTRSQVMYLHRFIATLALSFTGLHVVGLMLDTYLKINLVAILLPFTMSYRPLWSGLGTLAIYGALAVAVTAYMSKRLGYKVWRTIHYLSFGIFAATFLHGLMAGTDSTSLWMQVIYLVTGGTVATLTGLRFFKAKTKKTVKLQAVAKAH